MSTREIQQIINFDQLDEALPILIHSRNVCIQPSSRTLDNDSIASTKITTQNVVDYSWEDRYTLGHLISYHSPTSLISYVLSISNNYMIRILNEQQSSRCLIKDFSGEITDIAFSKSQVPFLASIDINGSVKVNKVIVNAENIETQLILQIKGVPPIESVKSMKVSYSRVMWCWHNDSDPRGVEESEVVGTNISLLLGVVHGATFEVMQIDTIESELLSQADNLPYEPKIDRAGLRNISRSFQEQFFENESLADLFLPYLVYTAPGEDSKITSLAISSDAAALAVALRDGTVRFFSLDGSVSSGLKEAYSWRPFNGEAVWSLLFLDDCRPGSHIDAFWCHVVVGSAFNRELKLFRCDKWDCIQTVSFSSPVTPCLLSAHIDQSARYLIMSDIRRKALYVLELDSIDDNKTKLFKNVQEFVLAQSLLSFDINTITSTETDGTSEITIKLFTITKGAFQKMRVTYMSRGHRLNEILAEVNDENRPAVSIGVESGPACTDLVVESHQLPPQVSSSLLTHVSSLPPSVNSSFQDPAIISTHLHSNTAVLKSLPIDLSPTLQHLFSNSTNLLDNRCDRDRLRCANADSGDESGDEASLADSERKNEQHKSTDASKKFSPDEDEECGFPLPPYGPNGAWTGLVAGTKMPDADNRRGGHDDEDDDDDERELGQSAPKNNLISSMARLESIVLAQSRQIDSLTRSMQELKQHVSLSSEAGRCACRESRQQWSEQAVREIGATCHQTIVEQIDRRLREVMDTVAVPRITNDIGGRLDDCVRNKLVALESVTRDFLAELLHDKKFVALLANNMKDCLEKPLRTTYGEAIRKDLVPALGRTVDKLFSDMREVMRDGVKDVLTSVDESNKQSIRALEDRLVSSLHKAVVTDVDNKLKQLATEMGTTRAYLADGINKQTEEIGKLNESIKSIKGSIIHNMANSVDGTRAATKDKVSNSEFNSREMQINRFIASGEYARALNEALAMTDMRVLVFVCSRIQTKQVLSCNSQKPSALQSSSILALVQQLSRDFHEQFDLKFEYLFDALLSLDTDEPAIAGHAPKVLRGVVRRLQAHLDHETGPVLKDKITVLLRIVTSRLDSGA